MNQLAHTAAFVASRRYADPQVKQWLRTPAQVEKLFAQTHGRWIPENYLDIFEADMRALHLEIIRGDPTRSHIIRFRGLLFRIGLFVNISNLSIIMLKTIHMRPCAEGYKLFKVILFHLSRICVVYQCDFYVEGALAVTKAVLQKAFRPIAPQDRRARDDATEPEAYQLAFREEEILQTNGVRTHWPNEYHIARYCFLRQLDLARRFELHAVLRPESFEQTGAHDVPAIVCDPARFPHSDVLNFGRHAAAQTRGRRRWLPYDDNDKPSAYRPEVLREETVSLVRDGQSIIDELYADTSLMDSRCGSMMLQRCAGVAAP